MFKKILDDLYHRVIVSKKSTIIGLGILAADVVVQALAESDNAIVHGIAAVAAAVLTLYREKHPEPA